MANWDSIAGCVCRPVQSFYLVVYFAVQATAIHLSRAPAEEKILVGAKSDVSKFEIGRVPPLASYGFGGHRDCGPSEPYGHAGAFQHLRSHSLPLVPTSDQSQFLGLQPA